MLGQTSLGFWVKGLAQIGRVFHTQHKCAPAQLSGTTPILIDSWKSLALSYPAQKWLLSAWRGQTSVKRSLHFYGPIQHRPTNKDQPDD